MSVNVVGRGVPCDMWLYQEEVHHEMKIITEDHCARIRNSLLADNQI